MSDEFSTVPVDDKNFIGIGKMVFDTNAEWNIPHLHFMVDKTTSGNFEATLLEFGLVSWSESEDRAITSLVKQTHAHILAVMGKNGFDQFIQAVDDQVMDGYWRQYRKIEFSLARSDEDLSHRLESRLVQAVKSMLSEEILNAIRDIAKGKAERIVAEVEAKIGQVLSLTPSSITYTEIEAAA